MKNHPVVVLFGVLILAVLAYSVWASVMKSNMIRGNGNQGGIMCTADAMQCPDGSWVGRSGPACQFTCPTVNATTTPTEKTVSLEAKLGQSITPIAEKITPLEVLEDSRCAVDVQCIQAGTVRVRVRIESGMGTAIETFKLGDTITTETESMTLSSVSPENKSGVPIAKSSYVFTFTVSKR